MTLRNPQNERYTTDEGAKKGSTRKSAASAKPKSRAANTVEIRDPKALSPKEKKALKKEQRREQERKDQEEQEKYRHPDTPYYHKWRKIWAVTLGGGIICVIASILLSLNDITGVPFYITLALSYVLVFYAIFVDMGKLRRYRKAYAAAMRNKKSPEYRMWYEHHAQEEATKRAAIKDARAAAKEKAIAEGKDSKAAMDAAEKRVEEEFSSKKKSLKERMGF